MYSFFISFFNSCRVLFFSLHCISCCDYTNYPNVGQINLFYSRSQFPSLQTLMAGCCVLLRAAAADVVGVAAYLQQAGSALLTRLLRHPV